MTPWPSLAQSGLDQTFLQGPNFIFKDPTSSFSRRNLSLRIKLPSGRAARSWVALMSVTRAFRANLPALACMPSAISMLPMSSLSSPYTLQVESTAEAPSTSSSSLASLRISTHWSAGSLTEGGTWSSRSVNCRPSRTGVWVGEFCKNFFDQVVHSATGICN